MAGEKMGGMSDRSRLKRQANPFPLYWSYVGGGVVVGMGCVLDTQ